MTQTIQTPGQQKWLTKLMGYNDEIHYTPGKEILVADALSRTVPATPTAACLALSFPSAQVITQLQDFYLTHSVGKDWLRKVDHEPSLRPHFSIRSGLVYFKDRLVVPEETTHRSSLL